MKRLFVLIFIMLVLISCAGSGRYPPPPMVQADISLQKFRILFLQGLFCAAEEAFRTAIARYASLDSPCDIAEAYLQHYLMYSYIGARTEDDLNKALQYVELEQNCEIEKARIESYKKGVVKEQEDDPLTVSIRLKKEALRKGSPIALKQAMKIDRKHGWSALLWQDLRLLVQLTQGTQKRIYQKRLEELQKTLQIECLRR